MDDQKINTRGLPLLNNKLEVMTNPHMEDKYLCLEPIQGVIDSLADAVVKLQERVNELERKLYLNERGFK